MKHLLIGLIALVAIGCGGRHMICREPGCDKKLSHCGYVMGDATYRARHILCCEGTDGEAFHSFEAWDSTTVKLRAPTYAEQLTPKGLRDLTAEVVRLRKQKALDAKAVSATPQMESESVEKAK